MAARVLLAHRWCVRFRVRARGLVCSYSVVVSLALAGDVGVLVLDCRGGRIEPDGIPAADAPLFGPAQWAVRARAQFLRL